MGVNLMALYLERFGVLGPLSQTEAEINLHFSQSRISRTHSKRPSEYEQVAYLSEVLVLLAALHFGNPSPTADQVAWARSQVLALAGL
tara:strand:- start:38 stop:301 length:264 start_codon:yes stop_codon:yes gene_type:complete